MTAWVAFWLFLTALCVAFSVVPIIEALRIWRDEGTQRNDGRVAHYKALFEREQYHRLHAEAIYKTYYQEIQKQQRGIRRLKGRLLKAKAENELLRESLAGSTALPKGEHE